MIPLCFVPIEAKSEGWATEIFLIVDLKGGRVQKSVFRFVNGNKNTNKLSCS